MTSNPSLLNSFLTGLAVRPDGPCLDVEGLSLTYNQMARTLATVQAGLSDVADDTAVAAVYAKREAALFVGILSCLAWGKGYVPVSPEFPEGRRRDIIQQSGVTTIFTAPTLVDELSQLLASDIEHYNVVVLGAEDFTAGHLRGVAALTESAAAPAQSPAKLSTHSSKSDFAYLMFTSGSTGVPKGVPITHSNALQFVDVMQKMYRLTSDDRVICLPDFYFDLSIFPIWVAWNAGATIYVPSDKEKMMPVSYAQRNGITVWCSVPSAISFLAHFKALKPRMFPDIRLSIFCGEPLLKADAEQWLAACPNSRVDNLYGPTEVTVFSTVFPVTLETVSHGPGDVVSIGVPLDGVEICVVDDSLTPVEPGMIGELCLAGGQVAPGYWNNPALTEEKFCALALDHGPDENRWYRTGDLVVMANDGNLVFKGRVDDQVQVSGYRVELGDIEQAVRAAPGVNAAAAVYAKEAGAKTNAIYVFACGLGLDGDAIKEQVGDTLPGYMIPKRIIIIDRLPQNKNGKVDKNALKSQVEGDT